MKRKYIIMIVLVCVFSIGIWQGIRWSGLTGTAADIDLERFMKQIQSSDLEIDALLQNVPVLNEQLKRANDILAMMRDQRANHGEISQEISDYFEENGLALVSFDASYNDAEKEAAWDQNIETIKGHIDTLNSETQLQMIRLQSAIDKRNQAYEMAQSILEKDQKTRDSIVGNMR